MRSPLRLLGWLLVVFGAVIGVLALLTTSAGAPLGVNALGPGVFTASGRHAWIAGAGFTIAVGAIVLRATRRDYSKRREA